MKHLCSLFSMCVMCAALSGCGGYGAGVEGATAEEDPTLSVRS